MSMRRNEREIRDYIRACGLEILGQRRSPGSHVVLTVGTGDRTGQIVLSLGRLSPRNQLNAQATIRRVSRELANKKLSDQ